MGSGLEIFQDLTPLVNYEIKHFLENGYRLSGCCTAGCYY